MKNTKDTVKKNNLTKICVVLAVIAMAAVFFTACEHAHKYRATTIYPTCARSGYTKYACRCGDTYKDDIMPQRGHKFSEEFTIDEEATCLKEGTKSRHCVVCGAKTDVTRISKTEHRFIDGACATCKEATPLAVGLTYSLTADGQYYNVAGIGSEEAEVFAIPTTYKGKPVKGISSGAFQDVKTIKKILVSYGVESIGDNSFAKSSLGEIILPPTISKIGKGCFSGCDNLNKVSGGENLSVLEERVFENCKKLTSVGLSENLTEIKWRCFYGCESLSEVILPDSVVVIKNEAFRNCAALTKVILSENLKEIESRAFYGCLKLKSITIPENVTAIGWRAFYYCTSLESAVIGSKVKEIEEYAFDGSSKLTTIYYRGTSLEWEKLTVAQNNNQLKNAIVYYYSEEKPLQSGRFWRFVENTPAKW